MSAEDHMDVGGDMADRQFAAEEAFNEYGKYPDELQEQKTYEAPKGHQGHQDGHFAEGRPDSLDFLEEDDDPKSKTAMEVMAELRSMAEKLTELEFNYVTLQEKMEQAKKIYDEYRCVTLPNAFRMAGLLGVETTSGARVTVERKYYCSPNKNPEDQAIMIKWLEQHGGEDLIKSQAIVDAAQISKLIEFKIPHAQKKEVNTNSLKAWLKREVGEGKGVANIKLEDVPNVMHFICLDEAVVKI